MRLGVLALLFVTEVGVAQTSLRFFGNDAQDWDRVEIPLDSPHRPVDVGVSDFTIEWWMRAEPGANPQPDCTTGADSWINGNILLDRDVFGAGDNGDWGVSIRGRRISFGVAVGTAGESVCSVTELDDDAWHHVAVARRQSDGELFLWVDGVLESSGLFGPSGDLSYRDDRSPSLPKDPLFVIGSEKHLGPFSYNGWIDELRFSTVIRYPSGGNFTPPSAPFTADAETAALYHFDEGSGVVVGDSSGAAGGPSDGVLLFGGTPAGPLWSTDTPFDTIVPVDPTSGTSSSHGIGGWESDNTVDVTWSGAADSGGSGVAGYSVLFDRLPATLPDTTIEVVHTADPHSTTSAALADGNDHFFHLRTCDNAGNCTTTVHLGPFLIDVTAPSDPSGVASPSHGVGVASSDATIDVTWTAAIDATSGVDGYAYVFDNSATDVCDQIKDLEETATGVSSAPLADGTWYFHICTVDNAGNWTATVTTGPYVIDTSLPEVTSIDTLADTGDGVLNEGEVTAVAITQLLVSFDEAMFDPAGDSDPADVTNPANYALFRQGVDGSFETLSCTGGVAATDEAVTVDGATYAAATFVATLSLNGGSPLPAGVYRLLVCGSLEDPGGNQLDGNGDTTGGDDFARGFEIDTTPPQVTLVGSTPDTGDGALSEGEVTNVALTGLVLTFSEAVQDPAGSLDPSDVTNPSNYLLLEAGGDGSFETLDCAAGAAATDTAIVVDSASYVAATRVATLVVNGGGGLADGLYRLLVCGSTSIRDLAGLSLDGNGDGTGGDDFARSFLVDQTLPSDPSTTTSTSHVPSVWSAVQAVGVNWSGAADSGGSGVAGYSLLFDRLPATLPDTTIEVVHTADPHSTTSSALADGNDHYFHLRTCDNAGNCTTTVHLGPFLVDVTAPSDPSAVGSPSHGVGVASPDATIDMTWTAGIDATSGVDGYAYVFDTSGIDVCDQTKDLEEAATGVSSTPLADGTWYFHICTVDNAGNWTATVTTGPYIIDSTSPTSPTASSTSHTPGVWISDNTIDVEWSGATDGGSGVEGYSFLFDTSPVTVPDQINDEIHTADPHNTTSPALGDGNSHYFHLRTCDEAGNCSAPIHLGPYYIDTTPPTDPTVTSPSHPLSVWMPDSTVDIEWSGATDGSSGVAGYSFFLPEIRRRSRIPT